MPVALQHLKKAFHMSRCDLNSVNIIHSRMEELTEYIGEIYIFRTLIPPTKLFNYASFLSTQEQNTTQLMLRVLLDFILHHGKSELQNVYICIPRTHFSTVTGSVQSDALIPFSHMFCVHVTFSSQSKSA